MSLMPAFNRIDFGETVLDIISFGLTKFARYEKFRWQEILFYSLDVALYDMYLRNTGYLFKNPMSDMSNALVLNDYNKEFIQELIFLSLIMLGENFIFDFNKKKGKDYTLESTIDIIVAKSLSNSLALGYLSYMVSPVTGTTPAAGTPAAGSPGPAPASANPTF